MPFAVILAKSKSWDTAAGEFVPMPGTIACRVIAMAGLRDHCG
jgi:hypothetical protein